MDLLGEEKTSRFERPCTFRTILICGAFILGLMSGVVDAISAESREEAITFNIPAQSLESALAAFADQAKLQIIVPHDLVAGLSSSGLIGSYRASDALDQLLSASGLQYKMTGVKTITVLRTARPQSSAPAPNRNESEGAVSAESASLTEIVVSAQKRSERLQDVPVPVTVIDAGSLVSNGQVRLQDFYTQVPGFNVAPMGFQSTQILSIRGINTGLAGNPSVGITVDDVPYGASTNAGGGVTVPDFDPGDLARVEVLRGPQGTLYGASSLGGLLKFVTVDPSTEAVSGRVEGGTSSVYNGDGLGYNFRAAVNVPLSDTIAIRASGFARQDPGYINNPVLGIDGINKNHVDGGRVAGLWRPADAVTVKLSALFQETYSGGSTDVDQAVNGYTGPPLGDLQQNYIRGIGGYNRKVEAFSGSITAKLGSIDLTALSGYNINAYHDSWDYSFALGAYALNGGGIPGFSGFGVPGAPFTDDNRTKKFTQEIRLSSSIGEHFDWLVGVFYTHEDSVYASNALAADPMSGIVAGTLLSLAYPTTYAEYAGFTDLTYHFTDRFDVQIGGRASHIRQTFTETQSGPLSGGDIAETDTSATPVTYLLTPRFKILPDLMAYIRLASGYRSGGTNGQVVPDPAIALTYNPDKTYNYELGLKGEFLDRTLSFDTSVYYIDWSNVQITLQAPTTSYISNAGRAKSQGVEFSVESRPAQGLTIAAWLTWADAELKQGFPANSPTQGNPGDPLPYSSRFSGNLSIEKEFPVTGELKGFVGGTVAYVGNRLGEFAPAGPPPRQDYPAYSQTNLHAGVRFDTWTVRAYCNNVWDKRALLGGGLGSYPPYGFTFIQPRTVGLSIVKIF